MSRTQKSIKNIIVALLFFAINLVLQFVSRKIFIDYLGTEVLGLNATIVSILQFLNISELGISSAVACTLYEPLFRDDKTSISEILSVHKWLYRRIGFFITAASVAVVLCIPYIFSKSTLPLWYAYSSFIVLLITNLPGYFVNYDQVLLVADQKDYKIQYAYKLPMALKILCQIICIRFFQNGYIWWLICEFLFAILSSILLKRSILKAYPYLEVTLINPLNDEGRYSSLINKVKQLFVHKISSFALSQLSPIIIYALASLSLVTIYGNYFLIVTGVMSLLNAMFNSINGGVGNLVAENNKDRIINVFCELFTSRFFLVTVSSVLIYYLANSFVILWVGENFIIDDFSLLMMTVIFYINTMRSVVDSFLNAYGLFADIWAPLAETVLNVSLSIILGKIWGLSGILIGVAISLFIIVFIWKPYYLFKRGFKIPFWFYVKNYLKHAVLFVGAFMLFRYLYSFLDLTNLQTSPMSFLGYLIILFLIIAIPLFSLLWLFEKGMKAFVNRILCMFKR